jgi:GT2 family glycosyltransferase
VYSNKTVVFVPVFKNFEVFERCLRSLLKFTPSEVPIFVYDDCSPGNTVESYLREKGLLSPRLLIHRNAKNLGFVENCNSFIRINQDKNIIFCNSDILVSIGWFEAMIKPMRTIDNLATVTAITNNGTLASVRLGSDSIPPLGELQLFELNEKLEHTSDDAFPVVPVGVGHCILITSLALKIVHEFDSTFSPGYGEEVDFCLKANRVGLINVLSQTFVTHLGGVTFAENREMLQTAHHEIIKKRYPDYENLVSNPFMNNSTETLMMKALIAYRGIKVLIDMRSFDAKATGTSRLMLETVKILNVMLKENLYLLASDEGQERLRRELGSDIKCVTTEACNELSLISPVFDVVYTPHQISSRLIFKQYRIWARRIVFSQLDFISYDNYSYFPHPEVYYEYRHTIQSSFIEADGVTFISESARNQGFARGLISESLRSRVIYPGTTHFRQGINHKKEKTLSPQHILLYGASFSHKNFEYAAKIFKEIVKLKPDLQFVVIASEPSFGNVNPFASSKLQIDFKENLRVHSWITDLELKGQIQRATLILYPTIREGFGFVPFEAADFGTPTLFERNTSLAELFPNSPNYLSFNLEKDVTTILSILDSLEEQQSLVDYVREVSAGLTWDVHGEKLIEFLTLVCCKEPKINREHFFHAFPWFKLSRRARVVKKISAFQIVQRLFPIRSVRRSFLRRLLKV